MTDSSARQAAIQSARETFALKPVFLDTETTGLDSTDQIVEICVLDHDGRVLVESLVRPTRGVSSGALVVHGLSDALLAAAPAWPEVWPQVEAAVAGRCVAIYNSEFDRRMMLQSHRAHRLSWKLNDVEFFCVMQLYAQFHGEWNSYRGSYRWQSLDTARTQCRIKLPNAHRARADASLTRAVLQYVAERAR